MFLLATILVNHIFLLVPSINQANPGNVIVFQPFMVFRRTNVTLQGGRVVIPEVHHVPRHLSFSIWIPMFKVDSVPKMHTHPKKLTWNLKIFVYLFLKKRRNIDKTSPSLPNTLWVDVWTHKHLLTRPLGGPNTYSQGIRRILED